MGHVLHFEEAASLGDVLVVTITADKFITKKRSVSFTEEYRMRQVAALEIVDYVAIVNDPSAVAAIEALEPDVYVKGSEYSNLVLDKTANIFREKHLVESLRRPHSFHDRRDVLLDQAVAFPAGVAGGGAGQPAAAQRAGPVPRSLGVCSSSSRS